MALSNAERQRRHRQRLRKKGLVFVAGFVPGRDAAALNQQIDGRLPRLRLVDHPNRPGETWLMLGGLVLAKTFQSGGRWIGESPLDPQGWVRRDTREAALRDALP